MSSSGGTHRHTHAQTYTLTSLPLPSPLSPSPLSSPLPFPPFLSHFHLDHCGALPYFTEMVGYDGPLYMTQPTKAICPILLVCVHTCVCVCVCVCVYVCVCVLDVSCGNHICLNNPSPPLPATYCHALRRTTERSLWRRKEKLTSSPHR